MRSSEPTIVVQRHCMVGFHRMLRRVVIVLVLELFAVAIARSAEARQRHQINPVPFSHSPCSTLDNAPCTPSFCSVFGPWPCIPEIFYPYGENLQLTVESA